MFFVNSLLTTNCCKISHFNVLLVLPLRLLRCNNYNYNYSFVEFKFETKIFLFFSEIWKQRKRIQLNISNILISRNLLIFSDFYKCCTSANGSPCIPSARGYFRCYLVDRHQKKLLPDVLRKLHQGFSTFQTHFKRENKILERLLHFIHVLFKVMSSKIYQSKTLLNFNNFIPKL